MNHSFNIDIACKLGIEKAILLENMMFWLTKNIANNTNFIDGNYWTFNTANAFYKLFPYMSERSISRYLKSLETDGYLLIGNFNKHNYDRTPWYCFTNKAYELFNIAVKVNDNPIRQIGERYCQNGDINNMNTFKDFNSLEVLKTAICQNGESIRQNGESIRQSGETIPDINTYINTDKEAAEKSSKDENDNKKNAAAADEKIINFFNNTCSRFPKITKLTKERRDTIHEWYLETKDFSEIKKCFEMAQQSEFLFGKKFADFDWIIDPENRVKIIEGKYLNTEQKPKSRLDQQCEAFEEKMKKKGLL